MILVQPSNLFPANISNGEPGTEWCAQLRAIRWPASQPAGWGRHFCVALMAAVYGSLMHGEYRLSARDKFTPT